MARDLLGCVVRCGDTAGVIVETEAYHMAEPACHAYVGRDGADVDAVRPAGPRLRLPLVRDPRAAQRGLRARGRRRRRADPGAGAARGSRAHARAARRRRSVLGAGEAHPGAGGHARRTTGPIWRPGRWSSRRRRRGGRRSTSSPASGSGSPRRSSCRGGSAWRGTGTCRGPGQRQLRLGRAVREPAASAVPGLCRLYVAMRGKVDTDSRRGAFAALFAAKAPRTAGPAGSPLLLCQAGDRNRRVDVDRGCAGRGGRDLVGGGCVAVA